jgi:hypothetical protein
MRSMTLKTCSRCEQAKPLESFSKKGNGYQAMCKECNREYQREHYQNNKSVYAEKEKRRRKRLRAWLKAYKESIPCTDCGGKFPSYVMEFDHIPGNVKAFTIGGSIHRMSQKTYFEELDKCELVCSNCHKIRTHTRKARKKLVRK